MFGQSKQGVFRHCNKQNIHFQVEDLLYVIKFYSILSLAYSNLL